jgi:hypothetical protein
MVKNNRFIELDLLYKIVIDINNLDLEIDLEKALEIWLKYHHHYWLAEKLLLIYVKKS